MTDLTSTITAIDDEPTVQDPTDAEAPAAAGMFGRSRLRLAPVELLVVAVLLVYPIAWVPRFVISTVPRSALALLIAPVGLVVLASLVRRRDRAAIALVAVLVSSLVSAALAPAPMHAVLGGIAAWMTVAVYAMAAGWWALGRTLSERARDVVPVVLLVGVALNGLIGVLQVVFDIRAGPLATSAGRAAGLMGNPVYYGSFMAAVAAWWLVDGSRRLTPAAAGTCFALCFLAGLSGSRAVLVALVAVAVATAAARRDRPGTLVAVVALAGLVAASLVGSAAAPDRGAVDRLGSGESIGERFAIWRLGIEALADRPVFGWGLNHFDAAVASTMSPDFVATYTFDHARQSWYDPHNIVVMLLVSLGVVGLALIGAFVFFAVRGTVDWRYLAAAIAMALTWQLQPATMHTLPIGLLLLGLAVRPRAVIDDRPTDTESDAVDVSRGGSPAGPAHWVAVGIGAVLAGYLLVATYALWSATRSDDVDQIADRAAWFVEDPAAESIAASNFYFAGRVEPDGGRATALLDDATDWATRAAERTGEAWRWNRVAEIRILMGDVDGARAAVDESLAIHPWNPRANASLLVVARITEDEALFASTMDRVCRMELPECDPDAVLSEP